MVTTVYDIRFETEAELREQARRYDSIAARVEKRELAERFRRLARECRSRLASLRQRKDRAAEVAGDIAEPGQPLG